MPTTDKKLLAQYSSSQTALRVKREGARSGISLCMRSILLTMITPLTASPTWRQVGHTAACVSGITHAVMLGTTIQAQHVLERERTHLLNNLLLAQPAKQRQRANLVSRINQLTQKQKTVRKRSYLWALLLGLHLLYAGAYLQYRISTKPHTG